MDFEDHDSEMDNSSEMIPVIPSINSNSFLEESNYPTSSSSLNGHIMQNGLKSVSNSKLTYEQQAALEDPHEKDILELLQQMDDFDPMVIKFWKSVFLSFTVRDRFLML